ncbi:MAG: hypothetical protein LBF43_02530 [Puniceicoccales bacterium]|nr:hypothetical protein [Puniceicoccales bacterium]
MGAKARINGSLLYYIKTHRLGLSSGAHGSSSAAQPVEPRELFVYRFLEYSGFGPEVHFFWANERDFYIATKNIGYSASGTIRVRPYETVRDQIRERRLKLSESPIIEKGLFLFDRIGEIFKLSDLLTNSGNFFFIADELGQVFDFKIIDFDTVYEEEPPKEESSCSTSPSTSEPSTPKKGDGQGKSFAGYTPVKIDILKSMSKDRQREIFTPMIGNIVRAIEYAFQDMYLLHRKMPSLDVDDLKKYIYFVANNLLIFMEKAFDFSVATQPIDEGSLKEYIQFLKQCIQCIQLVTDSPAEVITAININGRNFDLIDVPDDGNCGPWAVLLGMPRMEFKEEVMLTIRQQAAEMARDNGADIGTIYRIQTPNVWLDTEDFQHFARLLNRPIAIVVRAGVNQTYRHFAENGDITDPHAIVNEQAFLTLINQSPNTIVIYQVPGHYLTLLPN